MTTPHLIICNSESEVSKATQQHLAVSALVAASKLIASSGILGEECEGKLRWTIAQVEAAYKLDAVTG